MEKLEKEILNIQSQIGKRIVKLRKERTLSQRKLAILCDMDRSSLRDIEKGIGNPTVKTLCRIAFALDVSFPDIVAK